MTIALFTEILQCRLFIVINDKCVLHFLDKCRNTGKKWRIWLFSFMNAPYIHTTVFILRYLCIKYVSLSTWNQLKYKGFLSVTCNSQYLYMCEIRISTFCVTVYNMARTYIMTIHYFSEYCNMKKLILHCHIQWNKCI